MDFLGSYWNLKQNGNNPKGLPFFQELRQVTAAAFYKLFSVAFSFFFVKKVAFSVQVKAHYMKNMTAQRTVDSYDPHFAAVRHRQRLWSNYAWRTTGRQRSWTVYRRRLQQWFSDTSFRLQHCAPRNREKRDRPSRTRHNTRTPKIEMLSPPQLG
jgi:hypothetical protein